LKTPAISSGPIIEERLLDLVRLLKRSLSAMARSWNCWDILTQLSPRRLEYILKGRLAVVHLFIIKFKSYLHTSAVSLASILPPVHHNVYTNIKPIKSRLFHHCISCALSLEKPLEWRLNAQVHPHEAFSRLVNGVDARTRRR
jgi:hypothetical protein